MTDTAARPIPAPGMIVFYVSDAEASARFYQTLLGVEARQISFGFAEVPLPGGMLLGLWKTGTVEPASPLHGGGGELVLPLPSAAAVDALCETFRARGAEIVQPPQDAVFGYNFLAADPDGHRLRGFAPPVAA